MPPKHHGSYQTIGSEAHSVNLGWSPPAERKSDLVQPLRPVHPVRPGPTRSDPVHLVLPPIPPVQPVRLDLAFDLTGPSDRAQRQSRSEPVDRF
ncbi:hypothetical protein ACFX2I_026512 [Malus domestica]